jgi:hypothetical protein
MNQKEMYDKYENACQKRQAYEDSIKTILTNIEYGKYSEKELLLEYVNLKALHSMKIHQEKKIEETKKALYDDFQRSIGYKE